MLNAQIAAGLWRRNGLSVREQSYHYLNVTLRDRTSAFDLLVLQAMACIIQPDHMLRTVVEQFDLHSWFSAHPRSSYEMVQAVFLAEECLQLVIGTAFAQTAHFGRPM